MGNVFGAGFGFLLARRDFVFNLLIFNGWIGFGGMKTNRSIP
jgi:hypothetical protein